MPIISIVDALVNFGLEGNGWRASTSTRCWTLVATALLLMFASPTWAQEATNGQPPAAAPVEQSSLIHPSFFEVGTWELMVTAGPAFGIVLFHSAPGHRYALQTLSWGWMMS